MGLPLLVSDVGHFVGPLAPMVEPCFKLGVLSRLLQYFDRVTNLDMGVLAVVLGFASETLVDCILVERVAGFDGTEACCSVFHVVVLV